MRRRSTASLGASLRYDYSHPSAETAMDRRQTKLVHVGEYVAEVDVELIDDSEGWSPCLSLEDAERLDAVRDALRRHDIPTASRLARVFRLTPVTA